MAQYKKTNTLLLILVVTMAALYSAKAQSGCTSVLISMSPCLNYISGNTSTPSSGCCSQLASVVRSQPQCLCQVLNGGGSSLGISINETQALALPKACNVQTPPTSRCNAASPTDSPSGTTTPSSSGSPPSGTGSRSNTVPSSTDNNGSSDATSTTFAVIPLVFSLLVAVYATTF